MRPIDHDDIEVVRSALHHLRDRDDLLGIDEVTGGAAELRRSARLARQSLVDELVEFLDARDDLLDLQLGSGGDQ
jgi:hypothetical protein